jgi:predicted DNA-binding protein (MmcQ/YjbR family)
LPWLPSFEVFGIAGEPPSIEPTENIRIHANASRRDRNPEADRRSLGGHLEVRRKDGRAAMTETAVLRRLRKICLSLPETSETVKWGHPTFVAGHKMFAALDEYGGRPCIAFRTDPLRQAELLRDPRFYAAPYAAAHGWVCMHADRRLDWRYVSELLRGSYKMAALKRMLAALAEPDRRHGLRRRGGSGV